MAAEAEDNPSWLRRQESALACVAGGLFGEREKTLRKRAQSLRFLPYTPRGFVGHLRVLQAKPPATQATILTK